MNYIRSGKVRSVFSLNKEYKKRLQKSGDCLEEETIQGIILGSRAQGRPKMGMN